jgi:hypothetical protein
MFRVGRFLLYCGLLVVAVTLAAHNSSGQQSKWLCRNEGKQAQAQALEKSRLMCVAILKCQSNLTHCARKGKHSNSTSRVQCLSGHRKHILKHILGQNGQCRRTKKPEQTIVKVLLTTGRSIIDTTVSCLETCLQIGTLMTTPAFLLEQCGIFWLQFFANI